MIVITAMLYLNTISMPLATRTLGMAEKGSSQINCLKIGVTKKYLYEGL